jgi:hypothetical protein
MWRRRHTKNYLTGREGDKRSSGSAAGRLFMAGRYK